MVPAGVESQDAERAALGLPIALEGFDGARLAGAVGAEQRHHLTGMPDEGQPVDSQGWAIADDDVFAHDGRGDGRGGSR